MNDVQKEFQKWSNEVNDKELKKELLSMNEEEKIEAFSQDIEFGTGGLRGIMGPGSNRMNIYTVSRVTRGFGIYLKDMYPNKELKVALATDPRNKHKEFSEIIIRILGSLNIKVLTYTDIKPTPMLSFLVRNEKCDAGIMLTASHNPKEYNGYKVYNASGAQLNLKESDDVIASISKIDDIFNQNFKSLEEITSDGLLEKFSNEYDQTYLDSISSVIKDKNSKEVKIIFTPQHGCSYKIMPEAFKKFNFKNVIYVEEQMTPDGNFSNTHSANPEDKESFTLALEYAKKNSADLIIGNDPDADRLGIGFKNKKDEYLFYTGNQTGTLLIDYLIKRDNLKSGIIYKTIVTGELGAAIAKNNGLKIKNTLTGFKFIGEEIETNREDKFIFGYEESYGYLINSVVRDKDAIQATLLIAEMTEHYKKQNITLDEVMETIYLEYGYFHEVTNAISLSGSAGLEKIKKTMNFFRTELLNEIAEQEILEKKDYSLGIDNLPKADVIKLILKNNKGWISFRPSGTEPKLKVYLSINSDSMESAENICKKIYDKILSVMKTF